MLVYFVLTRENTIFRMFLKMRCFFRSDGEGRYEERKLDFKEHVEELSFNINMATLSLKRCTSRIRTFVVLLLVGCLTIIYLKKSTFVSISASISEITSTHKSETKSPFKPETTSTAALKATFARLRSDKIVLLYWGKFFGSPPTVFVGVWPKGDKKGKCPVACEVTADHERAKEANAMIMNSRDPYPLPPFKDVPWILTGVENPVYTPALSDGNFMSQFHLHRSYRLDSDFPTPLFKKPNLNPPIPFENKTDRIMACFSNCEPVRTAYLRHLMKHVHVDSYGVCLRNKDGLIERYGHDYRKAKRERERLYKFVIVFFNQDCDYFVDEKIQDAFNAGAVPVVMSTDKIYEFLPGNLKNAIINVRDFKSPKELAERLKFLMKNKIEYNKYLEWKIKGLGHITDTVIGKYWESKFTHWCDMCVAISKGKWHKEGLKPEFCKRREYKDWGITP
ncbi:4-galactosyl-N-acetylglucosaminide 3-alpha-L-fucosyltransferase 9-like isoform X1 [Xenia sp. Carnegie-2017]|uniref:4-galactosyl-N-acetylglucosaminide 3-alpha-L-fucosyltransferase 9-like isoform X1 n=2 Tax=Xenia sp. Carnegie-2017 TaxID=2897299 RepID=UPI001F04FA9A|nr:4-galactosyl-N-acetylglucosaminide 3-alpha-L-fucosyltransferase 9-like isoform X1 [Xenia sp. Carnegie-2017]